MPRRSPNSRTGESCAQHAATSAMTAPAKCTRKAGSARVLVGRYDTTSRLATEQPVQERSDDGPRRPHRRGGPERQDSDPAQDPAHDKRLDGTPPLCTRSRQGSSEERSGLQELGVVGRSAISHQGRGTYDHELTVTVYVAICGGTLLLVAKSLAKKNGVK